ncbi:DUF6973 domain-containing protein [Deinococcus radiotolerans]|uniref:DUF6973 domain-containing protein n=1 Tax=Deinococcus radiotolerans TaxID=1309407 RepID=A0ABQ2FQY6_9DEIO|nr:hypothetical protein [Deinococcus radiotolerans]GGL18287.1 hypothetical protein GCM10010844_41440 [Deinococcus radiotolerans]
MKYVIPTLLLTISLISCGQSQPAPAMPDGAATADHINRLSEAQLQQLVAEGEQWAQDHPGQDVNAHALTVLNDTPGHLTTQWSIGEWTGLGPAQGALCNAHLINCYKTKLYKDQAQRVARTKYGNGEQNGKIDAYRHTYWNALMTRGAGVQWATDFANAHEADNPPSSAKSYVSRDMDYYNNSQGRTIGLNYPANTAADTVVEAKIVDYMTYGKLKVFNSAGTALVWSNSPDACSLYNC